MTERGFVLEERHRQILDDCDDLEQLTRWCRRAVSADGVDGVFSDDDAGALC